METDLNYDLMIELRKRETAPDAGRDEHSLSDYVSRFFRDARLPVPRKYMPIVRFLTDVLIRVQAVERHFGEGAVAVPPAADGFVDTAVPVPDVTPPKQKAGRPKGSKNKAKDAPE